MDLKNINLMNDALFKAMMCHENNRVLVIDFLHSVTGIDKEILHKSTFVGGEEIPKRKLSTKKQITDTTVLFENKKRIIVEMNQFYKTTLFDKNASYAFSVIIENTYENIEEYPKVTLINIDNFNRFKTDRPILYFKIRDEEGNIETKMYESIHLVLANMNNSKYNIDKEIKNFALFLKQKDLEIMKKEYKGDERYMAAVRTVADLTTDPNLIGYYDYEEERERELRVEKFYARKAGREEGFEEGKKEGIEAGIIEGKKEGIKEGIKEGVQKGIQEGINAANIEIAKKMLLREKSVEEIMEFTNLSFDAIENLRKAFDNK